MGVGRGRRGREGGGEGGATRTGGVRHPTQRIRPSVFLTRVLSRRAVVSPVWSMPSEPVSPGVVLHGVRLWGPLTEGREVRGDVPIRQPVPTSAPYVFRDHSFPDPDLWVSVGPRRRRPSLGLLYHTSRPHDSSVFSSGVNPKVLDVSLFYILFSSSVSKSSSLFCGALWFFLLLPLRLCTLDKSVDWEVGGLIGIGVGGGGEWW